MSSNGSHHQLIAQICVDFLFLAPKRIRPPMSDRNLDFLSFISMTLISNAPHAFVREAIQPSRLGVPHRMTCDQLCVLSLEGAASQIAFTSAMEAFFPARPDHMVSWSTGLS